MGISKHVTSDHLEVRRLSQHPFMNLPMHQQEHETGQFLTPSPAATVLAGNAA